MRVPFERMAGRLEGEYTLLEKGMEYLPAAERPPLAKGTMPFWGKHHKPATDGESNAAPLQSVPEQEEPISMAMLKRDELPTSPAETSDLLLGRGAEFEGKLTFQGTVRIDAKFTGSITTNDVLVVGEGARISAEIACGTIVVHGEVNGNVKAKTAVELHHPAKMRGNIETPSIMIEKGVIFHGELKMEHLEKSSPVKTVSAPAPVSALK
jgi:cytoskeletal protein CcmA (bactofilin family)